ncbi:class I SAM-dependent methyltransferase [Microlunatus parietis]|uniref:16S rRNA (Guanine1207-N2)-methyltransferase n=1 Tax=Microlunatus parietis TaxID=682979 RepID=A0A7Y9LD93_9ACTN|nr:class I SAM-dependent methyltransferase [Microlunatus parietis]NYE72658.1 16S rRNA (guanine1207-N2)-methyltransferase [Microlunatus parietis]
MGDQVSRVIMAEVDRLDLPAPRRVAVLDDHDGSLLLAAAERWPDAELALCCDDLADERDGRAQAEQAGLRIEVDRDLDQAARGAQLCLARLPKSLDALDDLAATVARHAAAEVVLLASGRVKHLTRSMNTTLERHFGEVRGSLGLGKARALVAAAPRPDGPEPEPRRAAVAGLEVVAYGGVFAGAALDPGTRLLLAQADRFPTAATAIDLGCGTGLIACTLARDLPDATVIGIDSSLAAVRSAQATAAANGLAERIDVRRSDGLTEVGDHAVDLIVCNPPFHRGTAKDSSTALTMITDAARVLRPGGELWLVYNTHLPYRSTLRAMIGRTELITQDQGYLVTRSRRPD